MQVWDGVVSCSAVHGPWQRAWTAWQGVDGWEGRGRLGRAWTAGQGVDGWAGRGRLGRVWTAGHETRNGDELRHDVTCTISVSCSR